VVRWHPVDAGAHRTPGQRVNAHRYRELELDCDCATLTNTALAAGAFAPPARSPYTGRRVAGRSARSTDAWPCDWPPGAAQADHRLYNNGRRLAVTVLPGEAFDYDFFGDLERSLQQRGSVMEPAPYIRARWKLLRPMTPIETHMDPARHL
jgi:hypothetical protein